jgi:hypothetical protein
MDAAMTPGQFQRRIRREAEGNGVPRKYVDAALKCFLEEGRTKDSDVALCLRYAQRILVSLERSANSVGIRLAGPSLDIDSAEMIRLMAPEVDRLRRMLFRRRTAPFSTLKLAAEWIERTAAKRPALSRSEQKRAQLLREEIMERIRVLRQIRRTEIRFGFNASILAYAKPDSDWECSVSPVSGSALDDLAKSSERLVRATGFSQAAIVAYILVGIPPILPFARIRVNDPFVTIGQGKDQRHFRRAYVSLEVLSTDFTRKQFRKLYEEVRSAARIRHHKPLTERHAALSELVDSLGGPPTKRGELMSFWRTTMESWNQVHPEWVSTLDALRLAYARLQTELTKRHSGANRAKTAEPASRH